MRIVNKTKLAELLGVSKSRISQYVRLGLPVRPDGLVDAETAAAWVKEHIDPSRAPILRPDTGRPKIPPPPSGGSGVPALSFFVWVIVATLRASYRAALEEGVDPATAKRLANLAAAMIWSVVEGVPGLEGRLAIDAADLQLPPHPEPSNLGEPT